MTDPRRQIRDHGDLKIVQDKYVYVFPHFGEFEKGKGNWEYGRLDIPIHQYERSGAECAHGMYGMDCVGFLYQCLTSAGVDVTDWATGADGERHVFKTAGPV
jgi:hypothetical protein